MTELTCEWRHPLEITYPRLRGVLQRQRAPRQRRRLRLRSSGVERSAAPCRKRQSVIVFEREATQRPTMSHADALSCALFDAGTRYQYSSA